MKNKLGQYTMAQFIDIVCGDLSPIGADEETARKVAESLVEQYNTIADPASVKSRLIADEKIGKSNGKIVLYQILLNLINVLEAYDDVRAILTEAGYSHIAAKDNDRIKLKIEQMLKTEEANADQLIKEKKEELAASKAVDDFRSEFDAQTAALIAHFKFAISHEQISASVYANLVNMATRQQRKAAAAKK